MRAAQYPGTLGRPHARVIRRYARYDMRNSVPAAASPWLAPPPLLPIGNTMADKQTRFQSESSCRAANGGRPGVATPGFVICLGRGNIDTTVVFDSVQRFAPVCDRRRRWDGQGGVASAGWPPWTAGPAHGAERLRTRNVPFQAPWLPENEEHTQAMMQNDTSAVPGPCSARGAGGSTPAVPAPGNGGWDCADLSGAAILLVAA
ncbi:hypothetical protein CSHISOI_07574 [Colletotrichum shisoi]|uniref:Uncharacterized protein n=1 Tax=Colletotrichum shisoi TaxID=2078593 RepID=A0A5Q4BMS8_9PEZI|nr:hypothetical protein CSHISOI_07574 [Colletotrichum shisoi]